MSADDCVECPFCRKPIYDEIQSVEKELKDAYTKLTASEYDKLKQYVGLKVMELKESIKDTAMLRIDFTSQYKFEDNGDMIAYISANCDHCKRSWGGETIIKPKR